MNVKLTYTPIEIHLMPIGTLFVSADIMPFHTMENDVDPARVLLRTGHGVLWLHEPHFEWSITNINPDWCGIPLTEDSTYELKQRPEVSGSDSSSH